MVRALLLCMMIAGAGDAQPAVRTPIPELRLGGGAFTLRLNTGWLGAQHVVADPAAGSAFDVAGSVNLSQQRGRLRLGGGDERRLRLAIQWDVAVESDMARIHSRLDLGFFGHRLMLTPPDVRVRPRFDGSQPGVDVSVPIIEGRF